MQHYLLYILIVLNDATLYIGYLVLKTDLKLTHLSLSSLLWDIGKQNSLRCDAAERGVPSVAILFAYIIFIEKLNTILKTTPDAPKNESGFTKMIMIG